MGTGRVKLFGHADSFLESDLGPSRCVSCSAVPQNLTSGRRSERLTPKSLILEVIGLGRMGPIFMAASCSQDVMRATHQDPTRVSLVDAVTIVRIAPALCGLQHRTLRNLALGYIAPDRNQQLAGEGNDGNPADPPAFIADAGVEPTAQGARRLMPLP
jgi:hypothetical protein